MRRLTACLAVAILMLDVVITQVASAEEDEKTYDYQAAESEAEQEPVDEVEEPPEEVDHDEEEHPPSEEDEVADFWSGIHIDLEALVRKKKPCEASTECDQFEYCHEGLCTPRLVAELGRCAAYGGVNLCVPFYSELGHDMPDWLKPLGVIGVHSVCATKVDFDCMTNSGYHWDKVQPKESAPSQMCRYHTHCDVGYSYCPEDDRSELSYETTCKHRWIVPLRPCAEVGKNKLNISIDSTPAAHSLEFQPADNHGPHGYARVLVYSDYTFGNDAEKKQLEFCASFEDIVDQCHAHHAKLPNGGIQHDACPDRHTVEVYLVGQPHLEPLSGQKFPPGSASDKKNFWATPASASEDPDNTTAKPYTFYLPKDAETYCCPGCGYWCDLISLSASRLGETGWRRTTNKKLATMLLDEVPPSSVTTSNLLIKETTNLPQFALKSGLFVLAWANFSDGLDLPTAEEPCVALWEKFYETYPWLPRSFLLTDHVHLTAMRKKLKCEGPNNEWVMKSNSHHGDGIQKPLFLEQIRRLTFDSSTNQEDCGKDHAAGIAVSEEDGKPIEAGETVLQEWMKSISLPLAARGGTTTNFQLMFRVFFATIWPHRSVFGKDKPPQVEIWYWPQPLHHLYAHNLSHYDPIYYLGTDALEKAIREHLDDKLQNTVPNLTQWEIDVAFPQALESLRKNVEWSPELKHVYESQTMGRYELGGIDFLVTHEWGVRILEISMDPLHENVPQIMPLHRQFAHKTSDLLLNTAGLPSPLNGRKPHGVAMPDWLGKKKDPEWVLLVRNDVEERPGEPESHLTDEDDETEDQKFDENPLEELPAFEGEGDFLGHGVAGGQATVQVYSVTPRVVGLRHFISVEEFDAIRHLAKSWRGESNEDTTGRHFEMSYDSELDGYTGRSNFRRPGENEPSRQSDLKLVRRFVQRLDALLLGPEKQNMMGGSLRVRRYIEGQGHPPHVDSYNNDESTLLMSVMLTMRTPVTGGATRFTKAKGPSGGLDIFWDLGELALWWSCNTKGKDDPSSEHLGATVKSGVKWTATYFIYHNDPASVCDLPHWKNVFSQGVGQHGHLNWTMPFDHSEEL